MIRRFQNPTSIEALDVDPAIAAGETVVIQFSHNCYTEQLLESIDALCIRHSDQLSVRFYDHRQSGFDANVLSKLPNIQQLALECWSTNQSLEIITSLEHLTNLAIGAFELDDKEMLSKLPIQNLTSLSIGPTRKRNIDLSALAACRKLKSLGIAGHSKNIDSIASLSELSKLALGSIKKQVNFTFINELKSLLSLSIAFGSRDSIEELDNPYVTDIELLRVRGLSELGPMKRFTKLANLRIENQPKITQIDFTKLNQQLGQIVIVDCKGLSELLGFSQLRHVDNILIVSESIDLAKLIDNNFPSKVNNATLTSRNDKMNEQIRARLHSMGIEPYRHV